jgi:hypothetical protein
VTDITKIDRTKPTHEGHYGGFETTDYRSNYCEELDGWFIAPEAGDYKFYTSGDDSIALYFDKVGNVIPEDLTGFDLAPHLVADT